MRIRASVIVFLLGAVSLGADEPLVSYIFPAGGQRGTTVEFKVGGNNLHGEAGFEMLGEGVETVGRIRQTNTVWFEGPVIPQPASQQLEDYPKDYAGWVKIAAGAEPGIRHWRVWTSQGATASSKFVVGDLPEVIEKEVDGTPIPERVNLPVTINGRIFPREDVDVWVFAARAGEQITCEVQAKQIGSPLEARLELLSSDGRQLGEAVDRVGKDPRLHFRAPADGEYSLRISDVNAGGLQHFVYRLAVTSGPYIESVFPLGGRRGAIHRLQLQGAGIDDDRVEVQFPEGAGRFWKARFPAGQTGLNPVVLAVDDMEEREELEPNDERTETNVSRTLPVVWNGMIERPGDVDHWAFHGTKDQTLFLDVWANRLGSPLESVLTVFDSKGNSLAQNDDGAGDQSDSWVEFKVPEDGVYVAKVQDRFSSRGGRRFGYRLKIGPAPLPAFELRFATDAVNVYRETPGLSDEEKKLRPQIKQGQLKIEAVRVGGFKGAIDLICDGLPEGVTAKNPKIAAGEGKVDLVFTASPAARIQAKRIQIRGVAEINGQRLERRVEWNSGLAEEGVREVLMAVCLPTPFKATGEYLLSYATRGSVYKRRYKLMRNGFAGPLVVRLADRQVRHLQGVEGPVVELAPESGEFEYPVTLPSWMEIGRTSRAAVMLLGKLKEPDGSEHWVSYSSGEQNDQIIAVVSPGLLSLDLDRSSLRAVPGQSAPLQVRLQKDPAIAKEPVKVELIVPEHFNGVRAEPLILTGSEDQALIMIQFEKELGGLNCAVRVRATAGSGETAHFAEKTLELDSLRTGF